MAEPRRILIIEDNRSILETLQELFAELGYETEFASNGKEALDRLINRQRPDIILLDLFLPMMNGIEFRQRQLQIPYLATIPVVAMSADAYVKRRCAPLHITHCLKKPFAVKDLLEILESIT